MFIIYKFNSWETFQSIKAECLLKNIFGHFKENRRFIGSKSIYSVAEASRQVITI